MSYQPGRPGFRTKFRIRLGTLRSFAARREPTDNGLWLEPNRPPDTGARETSTEQTPHRFRADAQELGHLGQGEETRLARFKCRAAAAQFAASNSSRGLREPDRARPKGTLQSQRTLLLLRGTRAHSQLVHRS